MHDDSLEAAIAWVKFEHERWMARSIDTGLLNVFSFDEIAKIPPCPPWAHRDMEEAYRRGFSHAVAQVGMTVRSLKRRGFNRPEEIASLLEEWNYKKLYPWRDRVWTDYEEQGHPEFHCPSWWDLRKQVFARDQHQCVRCGAIENLQCDHIDPVMNGGLPTLDNLQTLCHKCHVEKGLE